MTSDTVNPVCYDFGENPMDVDPSDIIPPPSSNRHEAAKTYSFDQTFIDEPIDSIEARVVPERQLEITDLEWLFGNAANSHRSVGISPAYSKSGSLPALACALGNRVLIIKFLSSKPHEDGSMSGPRPRNIDRRNQLEQELLCHPDCTLYAFDLAPLALSLRLHLHLHVSNAIDIQSALPVPTRSPVDSVKIIISDASPIFDDNITSAFETTLFVSDKHKDLTGLVQRAWLCGYIGQYDLGTAKDLFYKAPKVDMMKFSADVSLFLNLFAAHLTTSISQGTKRSAEDVIRHPAARQYEAHFRDPRDQNRFQSQDSANGRKISALFKSSNTRRIGKRSTAFLWTSLQHF